MKHEYTLILSRVAISPTTSYGYWDREDGSEGGGLWFEGKDLVDYDGAFFLPRECSCQIRELGYNVGPEFEPD